MIPSLSVAVLQLPKRWLFFICSLPIASRSHPRNPNSEFNQIKYTRQKKGKKLQETEITKPGNPFQETTINIAFNE